MDIELLKSPPDDQIDMMFMPHFDFNSSFIPNPNPNPSTAPTAPPFENPDLISFSQNSPTQSPIFPSYPLPTVDSSNNLNSKQNSMAAMREMIFRIAAMQPIYIDPESVKPPKRRNVKISKDPQSIAARHRRERISERIRILQRLVPGGTKMDTASMLDEAIHYVKFLKTQVQSLERAAAAGNPRPVGVPPGVGFPVAVGGGGDGGYFQMSGGGKGYGSSSGGSSVQSVEYVSDA